MARNQIQGKTGHILDVEETGAPKGINITLSALRDAMLDTLQGASDKDLSTLELKEGVHP